MLQSLSFLLFPVGRFAPCADILEPHDVGDGRTIADQKVLGYPPTLTIDNSIIIYGSG